MFLPECRGTIDVKAASLILIDAIHDRPGFHPLRGSENSESCWKDNLNHPMKRVSEPELMLEEDQALAYAEADFSEPHNRFVELFKEVFANNITGYVLDLGCGSADISIRFAKAYPQCTIHGVDGSKAMLKLGQKAILAHQLDQRIQLISSYLPTNDMPRKSYDAVISNSLLHHLRDPQVLWQTVRKFARPGTPVLVMDLMRPESEAEAKTFTATYVGQEPEILRRDFYNSLLAAYTPDEVQWQLERAGLTALSIRLVSDRHFAIYGRV